MYQHILVPVDGSPTSMRGLAEAIELARLTGGRIRLVHVVDMTSLALNATAYAGYVDVLSVLREGGQAILESARAQVAAAGVGVDTQLLDGSDGRVSDQVVSMATSWPADVVVVGTHGRRGVDRLLIGSDAEQIVRLAPVPVLLVRAAAAASPVRGS